MTNMTDHYVSFEGDNTGITDFLKQYYREDEIELVKRSFSLLRDSLDSSEKLVIHKEVPALDGTTMGLMFLQDNYYINVRISSIAFLGLILDVAFTKGFASFVLATFGVTAKAIRKLKPEEKKVLVLVRAGKVRFNSEGTAYVIEDEVSQDFTDEDIKAIILKLEDDDIVYDKDGVLKMYF